MKVRDLGTADEENKARKHEREGTGRRFGPEAVFGEKRGINSETHQALAEEWEAKRSGELTLLETFQFLKSCHRRAPFLFYNGNTFAEIGRGLSTALFSNLPTTRRKEASSLAAHFITGVLEENLMVEGLNALC